MPIIATVVKCKKCGSEIGQIGSSVPIVATRLCASASIRNYVPRSKSLASRFGGDKEGGSLWLK